MNKVILEKVELQHKIERTEALFQRYCNDRIIGSASVPEKRASLEMSSAISRLCLVLFNNIILRRLINYGILILIIFIQ